MNSEHLIPILITLGAFAMVFGLRYLSNKENMAMIEKGMEPIQRRRRQADPSRTLKNSLLFIGAAQQHPLSVVFEHALQVGQASQVVPEFR